MKKQTFESVWDALEDNPVQAQNMKFRSEIIAAISDQIKKDGLTRSEAAKLLHISQPRVSALLKGKFEAFRLDSLVNMAHQLGLTVSVEIAG